MRSVNVLSALLVWAFLSLAGIAIGFFVQFSRREEARATGMVLELADGLRLYRQKVGHLPENLDALAGKANILTEVSKDPWGRPFRYVIRDDGAAVVWTYGADDRVGGEGENADRSARLEIDGGIVGEQ